MKICTCGHEFDDHESVAEGSLPMCVFCPCLAPKEVPSWIQKLRDLRSNP